MGECLEKKNRENQNSRPTPPCYSTTPPLPMLHQMHAVVLNPTTTTLIAALKKEQENILNVELLVKLEKKKRKKKNKFRKKAKKWNIVPFSPIKSRFSKYSSISFHTALIVLELLNFVKFFQIKLGLVDWSSF